MRDAGIDFVTVSEMPGTSGQPDAQELSPFSWPIWIGAFLLGSTALLIRITHEGLWHDECFTEAITRHSFTEIIALSRNDNNTPFYYCALYLYRSLLGDSIFVLRSFSVLAGIALAGLGMGPIRRALGGWTGFLFVILVFTTPNILSHAREVRAYAWAAFFVTGAAVYSYLAIWGKNHSRERNALPAAGRSHDWPVMIIFLVGACYIHPFGLLAACFIAMFSVVDCGLFRRQRLRPLLLSLMLTALAFVPWLGVMRTRISSVTADFWISPVDVTKFFGVLIYPYVRKFEFHFMAVPAALISFAISLSGLRQLMVNRVSSGRCVLHCVAVYAATIAAAVVISLTVRPILEYRYIIPLTGLSLLVVAWGLAQLTLRWKIAATVALVSVNVPAIIFQYAERTHGPMREVKHFLDREFLPGDFIIHVDEATAGTFHYYFPDQPQRIFLTPQSRIFSDLKVYRPRIEPVNDFASLVDGCRRLWLVRSGLGMNTHVLDPIRRRLPKPVVVREFRIPKSWYTIQLELIPLE